MLMLEDFKNKTLGGSFGNPRTNTYVGQCVSYARKYMEEVLGILTYPDGDAKDYWDNTISRTYFDKVPTPQNGDIVVYGATKDNPYGHIGIWYNSQLLSQNFNVPLHVTIWNLNHPNLLGFLRIKGDEMVENTQAWWGRWAKLHRQLTGADADKSVFDKRVVGKTWVEGVDIISNSPSADKNTEMADFGRQVTRENWRQNIKDLNADIDKLKAGFDLITEPVYRRKK